jgi:hypothetical protein
MPRVAFLVQDFLQRGNFLNSQDFVEPSVWGNIPWGPSLVFFYAIFLKISNDPLMISYLLSATNILGVLSVTVLTWKYFSKNAGIFVGFLLATNPYWLTYVRIIYQPSPVTLFIPISMLLLFLYIGSKNKLALVLLPVSWAILIQVYLPTYSFILTSLLALFFCIKRKDFFWLLLGAGLSLILFLPSALFYSRHVSYLYDFIKAPSLFTPHERTLIERIKDVAFSYFQILMGGKFNLQMGYTYIDFIKTVPFSFFFGLVLPVIFGISIVWNVFIGVYKKEYIRLVIFFWALAPFWSLVVLRVSDILPRYFLIAFPAAMILISLFFADLIKITRVFWLIPVALVLYWVLFNVSFDNFVRDYNYPGGRMIDVAESPYIHLNQAIGWVTNDSKFKKCNPVLSNNEVKSNFDVWLETKYIWKYIYHRKIDDNIVQINPCYYLIKYRGDPEKLGIEDYKTFGPFTAFGYIPTSN